MAEEPRLHVVIPAGGSGTRLWPLSRASRPKFLHALTGTGRTLLQETVDRMAGLAPQSQVHVVTGVTHAAAVARQLPDVPEDNLFVEPSPRDSCAAIALAAAVIGSREPGALMGAFPADHMIGDVDRFRAVVRQAAAVAAEGRLTTIGITPTRPEVGYGYLRTGESLPSGGGLRVAEFKEKPSYDVAAAYLKSGDYLWNAGMFLWRVSDFLDELSRQRPDMHAGVSRIAGAWDSGARDAVLAEAWPRLEKISVDYAVMEGAAAAGRVATVPGDFAWNDIGDFRALGDMLPADESRNVVIGAGDTLLADVEDVVVAPVPGRLLAALGVRDLVIVDTEDAVLVCHRDRAQDVKKLVDALRDRGDTDHV
ncbi:MAG: mannose-1-phosphate guanylyltransferase [Micromonosporaceae bacterium]|nr:mannose-1-phosphate guanylyltransferase [Micromonosporaceae bacterium]